MKPHLHPSHTLFTITVILASMLRFPAIWCQVAQPYEVCNQEIECGNVKLEYPFWGLDRPVYCGHPGFQITCQSDVPQLVNQSVINYRVLDADSITNTVTVARNDLWDTLCPQYLYNTTYNTTLFNENNFRQENVSLFYGCNTSLPVASEAGSRFLCTVNETQSENYFIRTSSIVPDLFNRLVQCNSYITVPVNQTSADRLGLGTATTDDLRDALKAGFNLGWMANNNECDECIQTQGRCGSNVTSPELFACHCSRGSFSRTCDNRSVSGEKGSKGSKGTARKLILGFTCGFVGILILLFVILFRKKRLWETRKDANHKVEIFVENRETRKYENHKVEIFIKNYGTLALKRFKYSEIKKITNSFVEILGKGGFGNVYKGQLPDGQLVAVKLLAGTQGDGEDFINEVASIGRTSHVNVVTLLGFCIEGKKRALMYEFMPNGSLDKFLRRDGSHLDNNTLFQIAKGIARGLEYLHRGCNTRIVHFDIKPHNILLDEEFVPKISDFGLAKLCKRKESIVSVMGARGTAGYMAPEVFFRSLGGASHKSDVYSYGMMVLEMTGAHKNNKVSATSTSEAYFPDWVYKQIESGTNLGDHGVTTEYEEELARKMTMVSLWCIQSDPSDRPSISKVVEMLEGSFESLQVPPRRFWSSDPSRPAQGTSPSVTQSSSGEILSSRV